MVLSTVSGRYGMYDVSRLVVHSKDDTSSGFVLEVGGSPAT